MMKVHSSPGCTRDLRQIYDPQVESATLGGVPCFFPSISGVAVYRVVNDDLIPVSVFFTSSRPDWPVGVDPHRGAVDHPKILN